MKKFTIALAVTAVFLAAAPAAIAQSAGNIQTLIAQEEGGQGVVNTSSSAAGLYQTTFASLTQSGFITGSQAQCCGIGAYSQASWNGPLAQQYGVTSLQDFLNNPQAQAAAFSSAASNNYNQLMGAGGSQYIGQTYDGLVLNQSALVECSYVLGGSGCANALANGTVPNQVLQRMQAAEPYDSSSITGQATSAGGGSIPGGIGNSGPTGSALGLYCNPAVAQALVNIAAAKVQGDLAVASYPQTGFTMLNGGSVLQQAGLGGTSGSGTSSGSGSGGLFTVGGPGSFRTTSCLNNLLSGSGLSVIFSPPSLQAIENMLMSAVCQGIQSMFSQMLAPLQQSLYQSANLGGFFPGMAMGSIGGGINLGGTGISISGPGGAANWNFMQGGDNTWFGISPVITNGPTGYYGPSGQQISPSNLGGLFGTAGH
jgi:hypothetical protein